MKTHLVVALVAFAAAAGTVVLAWWALAQFHRSLGVVGGARDAWAVVVVVAGIAVAGLLVPAGAAVVHSVRAGRLARRDERRAARIEAARATDAIWYVVGIGVTVLVVVFLIAFVSAKDGAIRRVFLNWDVVKDELPSLRKGFWLNVKTFMVAEVLVLIFGLLVAVVRLLPGRSGAPARFLAIAYTDTFRGFPLLIVVVLFVLGMQLTQLDRALPIVGVGRDARFFWLCTLALVLGYSAYVAEVYRAGLESIHWSQTAAARSLGLSYGQTLRSVVVPQAVRRIIPPLLNDFISLQKDTALLSTIGALDIVARGRPIANSRFNLTPIFGAGLAFLVRCGKSTLLRCINALEPIQAGTITVGGEPASGPGVDLNRLRQDVGIVFQSFNLFPHMTALANVMLAPRKVLRMGRAEAEARARTLLDRVGLGDKADEYPDRLSGGRQQRVAVVRALAVRPRLLLLDEITSALDPELVAEVLDIVRELAIEGMTMMLATHEMAFARDVATKVCFLDAGVVCEEGPPEQMFTDPTTERTRAFLTRIIKARRLS